MTTSSKFSVTAASTFHGILVFGKFTTFMDALEASKLICHTSVTGTGGTIRVLCDYHSWQYAMGDGRCAVCEQEDAPFEEAWRVHLTNLYYPMMTGVQLV